MPDASPKATHVLIADTNARTLAARAEQLLAAGLKVSRARTSFEAIVKASCHVPDFILLDGLLGELNVADTLATAGDLPGDRAHPDLPAVARPAGAPPSARRGARPALRGVPNVTQSESTTV